MEDSSNCDIDCDGESVAMIPNQKTLTIDCPSSSDDVDVSSMVSVKEGCESPLSSWDSEPENDMESVQDINLEGNFLDMEEQNHFVGVENVEDGFSWEVDNRSYEELLKKFTEKEEELRVSNVKLQLSEQEIVKLKVEVEDSKIQINDVCEKLEVKEYQLDNLGGELNWKNDELDNVLKELELKEEELNEAKKVSGEEIFKLKNQIKESENQLNDVRGELNLKKEEFEKETDKLRIRVSESSTKIRNLKEQLKTSTDEISFFRKQYDIKSSMANQLQCQIKREMQNRAMLESFFIMNKDDNINHKEELNKMKLTMFDKHLEFHCEKTKMEGDIISLSNQKKQLTSKLENYESRNKELEQKLMRNEAENSKHLQCEIRYLTKKLGERVTDAEAGKMKLEKVMIEIGEANVKIDELKAEICSRDDEISSMKKYTNELNTSLKELAVDYRTKVTNETKLIIQVEGLKKEVSKQNGVILDMAEEKKEAIRELCNSVEHYRNAYDEVIQAFNDLYASRRSHCYGFLNI